MDRQPLSRSRPALRSLTGPDGLDLSDRWQDALVMKDMIRALRDSIASEEVQQPPR